MISSSSVPTLVAVTKEAERALGGRSEVRVEQVPFKVGRERRVSNPAHHTLVTELRRGLAPQLNDVYLLEPPGLVLLQISGEHFAIEYPDTRFFLVDRGSACGTIVAGRRVGGDRQGGRTELQNGDEIVVGTRRSRYVFRFEVAPDCFTSSSDHPGSVDRDTAGL